MGIKIFYRIFFRKLMMLALASCSVFFYQNCSDGFLSNQAVNKELGGDASNNQDSGGLPNGNNNDQGSSLPGKVQNLCENRITHKEKVSIPKMAQPKLLEPYRDPVFDTHITRISDSKPGGVIKTMYNTVQAWNADESRIVLYHTGTEGPGHHLYDGNTYAYIEKLDIVPSDLEEVFWDPSNAEILYYIQGYPSTGDLAGALVSYNIKTKEKKMAVDIAKHCGHEQGTGNTGTSGGDVQGIYGTQLGVRCNNNATNSNTTDSAFYVDVKTGEISKSIVLDPAVKNSGFNSGLAYNIAIAPTPSNKYFYAQGTVLDIEMKVVHNLDIAFNQMRADDGELYKIPNPEHISIGSLANGHDAMFGAMYDGGENGCNNDPNGGVGSVVSYDLETGKCRVIIGKTTGWTYPLSGTHVSAISNQNPGWVTFSTIGYGNYQYFDNGEKAPLLMSELAITYASETEPITCRLAHARTYAKAAKNISGYNVGYFGEPHPVMSPSGTRILFTSDWYDSGSVNTYVINLKK